MSLNKTDVKSATGFNDNEWHFVVAQVNREGDSQMYVDGVYLDLLY